MQLGLEKGDKDGKIHVGHMAPFFMLQLQNSENKLFFWGEGVPVILS